MCRPPARRASGHRQPWWSTICCGSPDRPCRPIAALDDRTESGCSGDRRGARRRTRRTVGCGARLHGVPVVVKDSIDTGDATSTTAGSLALAATSRPTPTWSPARLRQAGAVILGKTNMSEWGYMLPHGHAAAEQSRRPGAKPVRSGSQPTRVELRFRGRRGGEPLRRSGGRRGRWLHCSPGVEQFDRRPEADGGPGESFGESSAWRTRRTRGPDGPDGRRRRDLLTALTGFDERDPATGSAARACRGLSRLPQSHRAAGARLGVAGSVSDSTREPMR